jgi:hypothetical protein
VVFHLDKVSGVHFPHPVVCLDQWPCLIMGCLAGWSGMLAGVDGSVCVELLMWLYSGGTSAWRHGPLCSNFESLWSGATSLYHQK